MLPRPWVLENIERVAEPHLAGNWQEEAYQRLLELYVELDTDLARNLAQREASHSNPIIVEISLDF